MILMTSCFSFADQRRRSGISASTSDQFSKAWRSAEFQRDKLTSIARLTSAADARRMRVLSPPKSRAMRRFTSKPRLRVEKLSQRPSAAKAEVEEAAFAARNEVVPF